jgi:molybdopterin converting factor small subunit
VPVVRLRAPLSELAGGKRELEHPDARGWILDEHGSIREHINVFVNKECGQEDTSVTSTDRLHVIPAISGG